MSMLNAKTIGLETKFYIKSEGKRGGRKKIIIWVIYGKDKTLADNKGEKCRQDAVINALMKLGFQYQNIYFKKSNILRQKGMKDS